MYITVTPHGQPVQNKLWWHDMSVTSRQSCSLKTLMIPKLCGPSFHNTSAIVTSPPLTSIKDDLVWPLCGTFRTGW